MSSTVFTQIASGSKAARAERLFHAAVAAFSALLRPTRAEIAQLDDLTLPLVQLVSPAALRFAAAALSDSASAPPGLVRRLCDESVEIAAPLLVRSPLLGEAELVRLIEQHGFSHARVIARRHDLSPAVVERVEALFRLDGDRPRLGTDEAPLLREAEENARRRLRGMMRGGPEPVQAAPSLGIGCFERLRDTALLDHRPFFRTALADALGVEVGEAQRIAGDASTLLPALHAAGLSAEQAFLIVAAVLPDSVQGAAAIRALLDRFAELAAASETRAEASAAVQPATGAVFRFKRA